MSLYDSGVLEVGEDLGLVLAYMYPELDPTGLHGPPDYMVLQGDEEGLPYIAQWNREDIPAPTEQEVIDWYNANKALEMLALHVQDAIQYLEQVYRSTAQERIGEPEITPLLLDLWKDNYKLARQWDTAGRPDPTTDSTSTYADAVTEASNRTDELSDPVLLLETWLQRGQQWLAMKQYMDRQFRPAKRAAIRAATTVNEIEAIKATFEPELRTAFGLS